MMRNAKFSWVGLGVVGLLALIGCASGPLDSSGSAHVVLQIQDLNTPAVTGSIQGSGVCSEDSSVSCTSDAQCANANPAIGSCIGLTCIRTITEWAGTVKNVPKNPLAITSPANDIVLTTIEITYGGTTFTPYIQGLGSVTVPADSSNSFAFDPITFQNLLSAFPDNDDSGSLNVIFTIAGETYSNDSVTVIGSRQLNVESCFD